MIQIRRNMWVLLSHSYATLISIVILMLVLIPTQYYFVRDTMTADKVFQTSLTLNIVVTSFIGIYLGGALLKMKSCYLWQLNSRYRYSLISSFVLIVLIASTIQTQFQLDSYYQILLSFVLPFCVTFFSAFAIIGKTKIHQVLISISPLGFYQLREAGLNELLTLGLFIFTTVSLIYYMLRDIKVSKSKTGDLFFSQSFQQNAPKLNLITKLNYWLGLIIINSIRKKKTDLGWALLTPQTRLSLGAIFNVALLAVFYFVTSIGESSEGKTTIETLFIMFYPSTLLSIIIEARNNIKQTRNLAHIYLGKQHQFLKNQILFIVDKAMLISTLVYFVLAFLMFMGLETKLNNAFVSMAIVAILFLTFAFSPLFMSLKWLKVTFTLVMIASIYIATVILTCLWIKSSMINDFNSIGIVVYISICLGFRGFTESVFRGKSMEELFKTA